MTKTNKGVDSMMTRQYLTSHSRREARRMNEEIQQMTDIDEVLKCLRRWTYIKQKQKIEVDKTQSLIDAAIERLEELKEAQS